MKSESERKEEHHRRRKIRHEPAKGSDKREQIERKKTINYTEVPKESYGIQI